MLFKGVQIELLKMKEMNTPNQINMYLFSQKKKNQHVFKYKHNHISGNNFSTTFDFKNQMN